jgi:nitrogen fixation NifU-like protein
MTNAVKGLTWEKAREMATRFRELARGGSPEGLPSNVQILERVNRFPQRVKCAVLPWETLVQAGESSSDSAA